jgi:C-terminal processing protease CtpA/Prc
MIRNWTLAAIAVGLLLPAAAAAQDAQPRARTRPRVRVETRGGPFGVYTFADKRGRIGVVVDTRANEAGDKIGARVEGITPGGPAEKAGLKAGDVITRFNTTALGGAQAEEDDEASGPGMKLISLARRLEPGDTVSIEYRRGTDSRKATLVAEDIGDDTRVEMPDISHDGFMGGMFPKTDMPEGRTFTFAFGSPWGGIEMVSLNPDLGDYFGTREGVLVVRAPEDSSLTLKGGDVIVSIGGRKPASPEQAMRILRSYDTGETVTLDVLRKKGHVNVTWKVPDEERRYRNLMPRMREEPSRFRVAPKMKIRDVIRTSRAI